MGIYLPHLYCEVCLSESESDIAIMLIKSDTRQILSQKSSIVDIRLGSNYACGFK